MNKFFFLFLAIYANFAFGQIQDGEKHVKSDSILSEKPAEFPKGNNEFKKLIMNNFAIENIEGEGKIHCDLYFIIEKDGSITDMKAIGENKSFNTEALNAITKIKDKWIPATINGVPVRYKFRVPLDFTFEGDNGRAKFPKGEEIFKKMIVENFRTEKIKSSSVESCAIFFNVRTDGKISNIQLRGNNSSFNKEVERAVSKIKEKWIPMMVIDKPILSGVKIEFEMHFK